MRKSILSEDGLGLYKKMKEERNIDKDTLMEEVIFSELGSFGITVEIPKEVPRIPFTPAIIPEVVYIKVFKAEEEIKMLKGKAFSLTVSEKIKHEEIIKGKSYDLKTTASYWTRGESSVVIRVRYTYYVIWEYEVYKLSFKEIEINLQTLAMFVR